MAETFSTSEFVEIELTMLPVPLGTKSTRYASGYRYNASDDPSSSVPPQLPPADQPPEETAGFDE